MGEEPELGLPLKAGFVVIALFFGGFGAWAALAPLSSAAVAPGVVIVDSNRKTIQHLEGGIIKDIKVRDGDKVTKGQVLVQLDETQARATLDLLRGRKMVASALKARLLAERDGKEAIDFPDWLLDENDPSKTEVIVGQTNIFEARKRSFDAQAAILKQRVAQYSEEINGLKGQIKADNKQLDLISEEITDVQTLFKKGLAKKPRLLALQRRSAEIEGSRGQKESNIARIKQSIGETRLRIAELKTTIISEVVEQRREVQSELFDIYERLLAAEDILKRTVIRSPLDGTVVALQVHTLEGVIPPGAPILDIVPSGDRLVVSAQVDPSDIDVIRIGQRAEVKFTALSSRNSVPVNGVLSSISADRLIDEVTGQSYYLVRISLHDDASTDAALALQKALNGADLVSGMQAEVMIITEERTLLDYILDPLFRSFNRSLRES